jgi:uncharacterized membrane protein
MDYRRTIGSVTFLFVLSAIVMSRQLGTAGYFGCLKEDTYTFSSWAWQFTESLKEGIIYPRWVSLSFWGYGSPTFVLYSPLAFYLVSLIDLFTHSTIASMNIAKFTALFLSGTGVYFLVKEFYPEKVSLLSASFFILLPYSVFEFYYIGSFASLISLIWISPLLLFTYRYIKNKMTADILYAGACYGGLILTHLLNAYMFTFVAVSFTICLFIVHRRIRDLIAAPLTILVGALLSAAYLLPLLYERTFINFRAFISRGSGFRFPDFFILPDQTAKLPADNFWPVYYGTIVFHLLFMGILIIFFTFTAMSPGKSKSTEPANVVRKFFLGAAIISMMLLFGFSAYLWETIPFFEYIQFPLRWLVVTVFAVSFVSASGFMAGTTAYTKKKVFLVCSLLLTCLFMDFRFIENAPMLEMGKLMPVRSVDWTDEHLPVGIDPGKLEHNADWKNKAVIVKGEGKTEVVSWKSAGRVVQVNALRPSSLRVRTFNFPGWMAYVDGARTALRTEDGTGAIIVDIPQGEHTLDLKFVDTPIRIYSKIISIVSFLALVFTLVLLKKKGNIDK